MTRYLEDGDLEIDNNVAVTRSCGRWRLDEKPWLFAGGDEGGRRAAILYTAVASCQQHGGTLRLPAGRAGAHPATAQSRIEPLAEQDWRAERHDRLSAPWFSGPTQPESRSRTFDG
ncbi:hypothetical protein HS125_15045 [bacterium]|nr:hypothetical protein [bacterium]